MKLQKLVFFVHAWSLALKDSSVLTEPPEAWQYGPVFSSLYHELKAYGSSDISAVLQEFNPATGRLAALVPNQSDTDFWRLFERVWERYGRFSALQLSALTHESGSPWEHARQNQMLQMPNHLVAEYYRKKLTAQVQMHTHV